MCATLPHDYACNWRATSRAGLTGPLVNPEVILKVSPPINPINTGAITGDSIAHDGTDARQ